MTGTYGTAYATMPRRNRSTEVASVYDVIIEDAAMADTARADARILSVIDAVELGLITTSFIGVSVFLSRPIVITNC